VFVALVIQHEMRMHHIVICGLPGCTKFFHEMHGSRSKTPSKKSHQAALRGGI
jgi:hypothetical protein